jgi:hypothetical protein
VIKPNNFVYKSLSSWSYNIAVGCSHACRFCYVPDTSTIKQSNYLAKYGVTDPDTKWGDYVLLRPWDEKKFLSSLRSAEWPDATLGANEVIMSRNSPGRYLEWLKARWSRISEWPKSEDK